ncbi:hypothetical protein R3W88_004187 [Solanum pinnatisectum]|uniref:Protein FAR1-RELATED SEQUENCE n=1 Tax=Solanum pinnatisectum TaxID=50273 RepID=A0AAV9K8S4_9SOLN|nr:hypothetical protein R3W88_004187 [Solanum pinnatisectum]
MDPNSQNSQLTQVLNNVLGLVEDDSLFSQNDEHNEDSDSAYDGPESYLHSDDEGLLNMLFEEMNQPEQEESINFSDGEEYEADEESMGNVPPTAILTDQCESIKAAIAEVLPYTIHSITIHELEGKWTAFIQKYEFQDRLWFHNLYSEKEKWVPVFLKHDFWAGMMSTQRSESMHVFFYGYISKRSSLKQFVKQCELAM